MDLKVYYEKIRELESQIAEEFAVVVSHQTADGGKSGIKTEVPRRMAARLMFDGVARLATPDEANSFREAAVEAKRAAEQAAAAARVQVTVLSSAELDRLKGGSQSKK